MVAKNSLLTTRVFIQDIAKVLGKLQQLFLPADANAWHKGLEVTETGFATQDLGDGKHLLFDLTTGHVTSDSTSWDITKMSAQQFMDSVQKWAMDHGQAKPMDKPEFLTTKPTYDQVQASTIAKFFYNAHLELLKLPEHLTSGVVSPLLLYPHHMDESFSWYPDRQTADDTTAETQYTYGFSCGDDYIAEPYYYVTRYPKTPEFLAITLPTPAYWHTAGFTGAVLKQSDEATGPKDIVNKFFVTIIEAKE